ncbi:MAG: phosphatidylserine decarboxylase [Alicyclobacillaceae bacterium]|nr:phosphatidylserine decarboxylase [Alicyclobacillaceae bacterium]
MPIRHNLVRWALLCTPKRLLTAAAGRLFAHPVSRPLIPWYVRHYSVDLTDASRPLHAYRSLLDLFTRELRPGTRPIAAGEHTVISPVDGTVAALGSIEKGTLIQAKGMTYSVADLLGNRWPVAFLEGGSWMTIYLSPRDYHRIHMPLAGSPQRAVRVPGTLYPVNTLGTASIPRLFAQNERWITTFDTAAGTMYLVEIGSLIVGSVRLTYAPELAEPPKSRNAWVDRSLAGRPPLEKGEEIGYFAFGSTVILLFERGRVRWLPHIKPGSPVRMGQAVGVLSGKDREEDHR